MALLWAFLTPLRPMVAIGSDRQLSHPVGDRGSLKFRVGNVPRVIRSQYGEGHPSFLSDYIGPFRDVNVATRIVFNMF
jgi:hypothetical protein